MKRLLLTTILSVFILSANVFALLIPSSNRVDWSSAGLYSNGPACVDTVLQINLMPGADDDARISNALTTIRDMRSNDNYEGWIIIYTRSQTPVWERYGWINSVYPVC